MKKIVAISGGFDPIHIGHVRMIQEAAALGDKLVVILNNDNWLMAKKGFVFMPEDERKEVLLGMKGVSDVIISSHQENPQDMSVGDDLEKLHPDIFANGGDRKKEEDDIPVREYEIARKIGFELVFNIGHGGKVQSSSELVENAEAAKKDLEDN